MPLPKFTELAEINKGWSGDKKYRAVDEGGNVYLLRVTNSPRGERYPDMFRMQKEVEARGVLDWYDNFTNVVPKWYKGV